VAGGGGGAGRAGGAAGAGGLGGQSIGLAGAGGDTAGAAGGGAGSPLGGAGGGGGAMGAGEGGATGGLGGPSGAAGGAGSVASGGVGGKPAQPGGAGGEAPFACDSVCEAGEACVRGLCRGLSRWTTLSGDVHHAGFNLNETGTPPLSPAWTAPLVSQVPLWAAVTEGQRIYVATRGYYSSDAAVWALDPADGHVLWKYPFGRYYGVGQPTIDRGHLYVAAIQSQDPYLYSFVASTGAVFWSFPFASQTNLFWAPLVSPANNVYFNGGTYGGFCGVRGADGTQIFFNGALAQYDSWSPTLLNGQIYTFVGSTLRVHDPFTNAVFQTIETPIAGTPYSMNEAPVTDGDRLYLIGQSSLVAYRPGQAKPDWTTVAAYSGMPAVANGVVYSLSGKQLRADDAATGKVVWSFAGDSALSYPPAVAGHFVYVASDKNVYAVDASTQMQVWTASPGGWLSIAGGRLYVAQTNGTLAAYNLTKSP